MGLLDAVERGSAVSGEIPRVGKKRPPQWKIPENVGFAQHEHRDGSKDGKGKEDEDAWMWPVVHFEGEHPNPWSRTHGQVGRDIDVGDHLKKVAMGKGVKFR